MNFVDRTYGFELEMADVIKDNVCLPVGYKWSDDETIVNTDGKIVTASSKVGGELNTPPLRINQKDRIELKNVLQSMFDNGGKNTWCHGFAGHIYSGDFTLNQLKNVFLLSYYTSDFIKKYADVGEWSEYSNQAPTPTIDFVEKVIEASNFEDLKNVFANSSSKGFFRHLVNITSYYKHKTIEFRIFNPTYDFEEIEASVLFMARFVQFAVSNTVEDFCNIKDFEDFKKKLKLRKKLSKKYSPLLFSGDQSVEKDRYVARAFNINNSMVKMLIEQSEKKIATVNPNLFYLELSLYERLSLTIYNIDELNHIMYMIWRGELVLKYKDKFAFLESYNSDNPKNQIAILLLFHKIRKYDRNTEYHKKEFLAHKEKARDSIEKIMIVSSKIVDMFSKCIYFNDSIEKAIEKENTLFFQFDNNQRTRATISYLKKYSNYEIDYVHKKVNYFGLIEKIKSDQNFMAVSYNEYLPLEKIGLSRKQIFYSSCPKKGKISNTVEKKEQFSIIHPPDDLVISDYKSLRVVRILPSEFTLVQKVYVNKVDKFARPNASFLVLYEEYCLGGFGFSFTKDTNYDMWLLSDFSTNNAIYRLSKLILLCIKLKSVQKDLQRMMKKSVENIYTKVYTSKPVSMKYRGLFKKVKTKTRGKSLIYNTMLGTISDVKEVVLQYKKIINR